MIKQLESMEAKLLYCKLGMEVIEVVPEGDIMALSGNIVSDDFGLIEEATPGTGAYSINKPFPWYTED